MAKLLDDVLAEPSPQTREFDDVATMRKNIFDNVLTAVKSKYPIENDRYRLELNNVKYKDNKPFTLQDQKKAIMQGLSLHHVIHGDWTLVDKATGNVVDKKSSVVAHVPYVTNRGTFIYRGSDYTCSNQARLRPGVYSRVKENGIYESHVNVKPGTGPSFRVYMEPDTGIFRMGVGQSTLKLYPILRSMGVQDKEIEKHWGPELLAKNIEAEDPRAVSRAFAKLVHTRVDEATADTTPEADTSEL